MPDRHARRFAWPRRLLAFSPFPLALLTLLILLAFAAAPRAQGPDVVAVESQVTVGLFSGKVIVRVFGSTASPDVPVRLELTGPPREVVFTQSVRRFGVKVNEPIDAAPHTIPAIRAELSSTERPPRPAASALEEAMIREGVLLLLPGAIKLEPTGLFFAEIPLPASAPPGSYSILIFHDQTGVEGEASAEPAVLAAETFQIRQRGFVALVSRGAKDYAFLYGLLCVLVALSAGWFTERVFRNRR
jgi:hypothetical protein